MSFFDSLNINASGMTAQRLRMDVISENIANINTTRTENGGPYKKKTVSFQERNDISPYSVKFGNVLDKAIEGKGVRVNRIVTDETEGIKTYDPQHPDADEDGYVEMPNVNIVEEMVNMISASRSYEANVTALNTTKTMMAKTLEISRP